MSSLASLIFGGGLDRTWARVRALFVPSVSVVAVCDLIGVNGADDAAKQLYDWERDRLFTLAKGLGATSGGVLATILVDEFENKGPSTVWVSLASVFVLLLLLWAGFILTGLKRLAEEYPVALIIVSGGRP